MMVKSQVKSGVKSDIWARLQGINLNKFMDKSIKPMFTPPRSGDVFRTLADISKAQELLGYKPVVDFEEGLSKTVEYFVTHQLANAQTR